MSPASPYLTRRSLLGFASATMIGACLPLPALALPLPADTSALVGKLSGLSPAFSTHLEELDLASQYWDYSYRCILDGMADPEEWATLECGCPMACSDELPPFQNLLDAIAALANADPETEDDRRLQKGLAAYLGGEPLSLLGLIVEPEIRFTPDEPDYLLERIALYGGGPIPDPAFAVGQPLLPMLLPCPSGDKCQRRASA